MHPTDVLGQYAGAVIARFGTPFKVVKGVVEGPEGFHTETQMHYPEGVCLIGHRPITNEKDYGKVDGFIPAAKLSPRQRARREAAV